jgi:hypothetical protein
MHTSTNGLGHVLFDSGVVAAGAVIDTPVLDVAQSDGLYVVADNAAGAATRNVTMDTYLDDGATAIDSAFILRTVAAGAKERGTVGALNSGALGTPALTFAFPCVMPSKVKLHFSAGGAANGRLTVFRR